MTRLLAWLTILDAALVLASLAFGEAGLTLAQYRLALADPASPPGVVIWAIRAPRAATAAVVGAALGLSGATLQGLLRNPLADPGVLGVSAAAALAAAVVIATGHGLSDGAIETAAMAGALAAGALATGLALRLADPATLILMGVAFSALAGAATSLVFNLSPSPIATSEVLTWLMGSAANRDWIDLAWAAVPLAAGAALCLLSGGGLRMLALGEETAASSALPMARLRGLAVAGASLLAGASVALAGVVAFVGLAAPHLVRRAVREDPAAILLPSALAGAGLVLAADLTARLIPTSDELRLGVITSLIGAPVFALVVWHAGRTLRS